MIKKIYFIITKFEEIFLIVCMFLIVLFMSLEVFFRYVLNSPLSWTEEIGKLVFVWMVFIGAGIGIRTKGHISMEFLTSRLSFKMQRIFEFIIFLVILATLLVILYYGSIRTYLGFSSILPAIKIPYGFLFLPVPISCFIMIIHISIHLFHFIKKDI